MPFIAVDLGGTKLAGAVFDKDGIIRRQRLSLGMAEGTRVGKMIISLISSLAGDEVPEGIGISVPGIARHATGTVWAPNIPGWDDYPIKDEIAGAFGNKVSIVIESDRTCSMMGEAWKGSARGCRNAIFLAVGTGIGAGIMSDGRIIHGSDDIAGATGWMALSAPYLEEYRQCGCFEYYASGRGIAENAIRLLGRSDGHESFLSRIKPGELVAQDVFRAYGQNDTVAVEVLHKAVQMWGMAAANFVSLFNPEKIIFGGGIFGPAVSFIDEIKQEAERWAQPVSMRKVKFEASSLGSDAAIYGSAFLAMSASGKLSSEPEYNEHTL
ncbi:MAG TPA: ROK family protein [Bacteroidales bacterium]|nr:ROK family protein [Bacteroidales bacterium]